MKHYKAIICLHNRISSLQNEIEKLKKVTKDSPEFNGFVFIQNDIENIESEINELTTTMQFIIDLNMKSIKTSKKTKHHCRLYGNGALNQRCEKQCAECKKNLTNNQLSNVQ